MAVPKKSDKRVQELAKEFPNGYEILNRLWLLGYNVKDLEQNLAKTATGTNNPDDIIVRLLKQGVPDDDIRHIMTVTTDYTKYSPPFEERVGTSGQLQTAIHYEPPPAEFSDPALRHGQGWGLPVGVPGNPATATMGPQPAPKIPAPPPKTPAPAPVTTPSNVPTGPPTKAAPGQELEFIKNNYPGVSWTINIPELHGLMMQGAREGWSPGRMQNELEGTQWWLSQKDSAIKWAETKAKRPEQARATVDLKAADIRNRATKMGVTLSDADVMQMAEDWAKLDWPDDVINSMLAGKAQKGGALSGDMQTYFNAVKKHAKDYFIDISDDEAFDLAQKWAGGSMDEDNVKGFAQQRAVGKLPYLADHFAAGGTAAGFFAGHINEVARLLEIDPAQVDLANDTRFNSIIFNQGKDGKPTYMTMPDTKKFIKSKDEYWTTGNAEAEVAQFSGALTRAFGR